jgi:prepilin-type N-terminal cleavage/methylation domain-containing protein
MKKSFQRARAFTLIELISVLAILGILLSMVILRTGFLSRMEERIEVRTLMKDLNKARNEAISEGRKIRVLFDRANCNYRIGFGPESRQVSLQTITWISLTPPGTSEILFSSSGAPDQATTVRLVSRSSAVYLLTVEVATGKVNLKTERKGTN